MGKEQQEEEEEEVEEQLCEAWTSFTTYETQRLDKQNVCLSILILNNFKRH